MGTKVSDDEGPTGSMAPERASPPDLIELRGLRLLGVHGLLDEERGRAQPFEVDVDLGLDLGPAGTGDRLEDTVDYGAVTSAIAAVVEGPHARLLEHLADRIAAVCLDQPRVEEVTVAIRKLRPPVPHDLASAGVRITRRRREPPGRARGADGTARR